MTDEEIKKSIETNKLKLGPWQRFTHFGIVYSFLFLQIALLIIHLVYFASGIPLNVIKGELAFGIATTLLGLLSYYLQMKRLEFQVIETSLSRDDIDKIFHKVAEKMEWVQYQNRKAVIVAKTYPSFFSGSWGEQITILFDKNKILVNSICDPDQRSSIVSMGRNKKNVSAFIEAIDKVNH